MVTCEVELTVSWSASMVRSREESTRVKPRAESWKTARICFKLDQHGQYFIIVIQDQPMISSQQLA